MRPQDNTTSGHLSDEILATRVASGNTAALETLYDRHAPTVLAIALKIIGDRATAEDVLQETFWRVWTRADTYQAQRGTFTGWLFRIVRNIAIDAYRRRNARPQLVADPEDGDPLLDQLADPAGDVAEKAQSNIRNRQVQIALTSLPRKQKQVLEMAYFYGMTRHEIAEATGEALGTIHTRARLALQKLRKELNKEEFEGLE